MIWSIRGNGLSACPMAASIVCVVWTHRTMLELYIRSKATPSDFSRAPTASACLNPRSVRAESWFAPAMKPGVAFDSDSPCLM